MSNSSRARQKIRAAEGKHRVTRTPVGSVVADKQNGRSSSTSASRVFTGRDCCGEVTTITSRTIGEFNRCFRPAGAYYQKLNDKCEPVGEPEKVRIIPPGYIKCDMCNCSIVQAANPETYVAHTLSGEGFSSDGLTLCTECYEEHMALADYTGIPPDYSNHGGQAA